MDKQKIVDASVYGTRISKSGARIGWIGKKQKDDDWQYNCHSCHFK